MVAAYTPSETLPLRMFFSDDFSRDIKSEISASSLALIPHLKRFQDYLGHLLSEHALWEKSLMENVNKLTAAERDDLEQYLLFREQSFAEILNHHVAPLFETVIPLAHQEFFQELRIVCQKLSDFCAALRNTRWEIMEDGATSIEPIIVKNLENQQDTNNYFKAFL